MKDGDTSIDVDRLVAEKENIGTNFEVTLTVEIESQDDFQVTLTGLIACHENQRYVSYDTLADLNDPIGKLQREWARLNQLFIVDRKKVLDLINEHPEIVPGVPNAQA